MSKLRHHIPRVVHATSARQGHWDSLGSSPALCATWYSPPHSHPELSRNLLHPVHGSAGPRPTWLWPASGMSVKPLCTFHHPEVGALDARIGGPAAVGGRYRRLPMPVGGSRGNGGGRLQVGEGNPRSFPTQLFSRRTAAGSLHGDPSQGNGNTAGAQDCHCNLLWPASPQV